MIRLKNGHRIKYTEDFDRFFSNLLESIITEARQSAEASSKKSKTPYNEIFLKELMDNCIYVTHQLFELATNNAELAQFMVTGFIFNSIIMHISNQDTDIAVTVERDKKNIIH